MSYFIVECEAPSGGFGPTAVVEYDSSNRYIERVDYLDLIFEVWLGGELIQDIDRFCVSASLWEHLMRAGVCGVTVRNMTVTRGAYMNEQFPNIPIPEFHELVLPRTARGHRNDVYLLDKDSIPDAEMFSGEGLPLIVTERVKGLLDEYGVSGLEIDEARLD